MDTSNVSIKVLPPATEETLNASQAPSSKEQSQHLFDKYKKFKKQGEYHVWQWLPTINGNICKEFWSLWPLDSEKEPKVFGSRRSGAPKVDFVDYVHLGTVSNCLMREKCVKRQMVKAPFETNTYTLCPQLELLLA